MEKGLILASCDHSLASLVVKFLNSNGRHVGGGGDDGEDEEEAACSAETFTAHSHLRLI